MILICDYFLSLIWISLSSNRPDQIPPRQNRLVKHQVRPEKLKKHYFLSPLSSLFSFSLCSPLLGMAEKPLNCGARVEKQDRWNDFLTHNRENYLPRTRERKKKRRNEREENARWREEKRGELRRRKRRSGIAACERG